MAMSKFPRTPHLAALGTGVTRDDLVMDGRDAADFLAHSSLVIEEKVDGTNLGISFHGSSFQLHLQHRGRMISPGSESQYAKLQGWLDRRMPQLIEALGPRYVLYGEWLAAQHSVVYTRLPDLFLAFDVLDTTSGRFLCKAERDVILSKAHVWPVRCIAEGSLPGGLAELTVMLLNTKSMYCDGQVPVEGLYVRQEGSIPIPAAGVAAGTAKGGRGSGTSKSGAKAARGRSAPSDTNRAAAGNDSAALQDCWLLSRAKLVHPNFSQALSEGNGRHWSTRIMTTNAVRPDQWPDAPWQHKPEAATGAEAADCHTTASATEHKALAADAADSTGGCSAPEQPQQGDVQPAFTAGAAAATAAVQRAGSSLGGNSDSPAVPKAKHRTRDRPDKRDTVLGSARARAEKPGAAAADTDPKQQCRLCLTGGVVALKGAAVDELATSYEGHVPKAAVEQRQARFGSSFHLTLIAPSELPHLLASPSDAAAGASTSSGASSTRELTAAAPLTTRGSNLSGPARELLQQLQELLLVQDRQSSSSSSSRSSAAASACQLGSWLPLGLGSLSPSSPAIKACFVVVAWPAAQQLRRVLGLPDKEFHITIGFEGTDVHKGCKSLSSLLLVAPQLQLPAPAPLNSYAGTSGAMSGETDKLLLGSLPGPGKDKAASQHVEAVVTAVQDVTQLYLTSSDAANTGRDGRAGAAAIRLACSTLLLAALQSVDQGSGQRSGSGSRGLRWDEFRVLSLAAARLLTAFRAGSGSLSTESTAAAAAATWALLARAHGRNGDLQVCARLAEAAVGASAEATPGTAAGAAAYAQLLLGKALWKQGDAAAALTAFTAAREAVCHRAKSLSISSGTCPADSAGCWLDDELLAMVDDEVLAKAIRTCSAAVSGAAGAGDAVPLVLSDPRHKFTVKDVPQVGDVTLMRNTSWVIPGRLMGASTPTSREHIAALGHLGVRLVVTLTEEGPLPPDWFSAIISSSHAASPAAGRPAANQPRKGGAESSSTGGSVVNVTNVLVPVTNYEPPTVSHMDFIAGLVESAWAGSSSSSSSSPGAVMVHCGGGKGRAGTVLACLLCKHGLSAPESTGPQAAAMAARASSAAVTSSQHSVAAEPAMSAAEAIRWLRQQRPGSIETEQQECFVAEYCGVLWQRYSSSSSWGASTASGDSATQRHSDVNSAAEATGDAPACASNTGSSSSSSSDVSALPPQQLPRLIICVGLPGSGKSFFAAALAATGGTAVTESCSTAASASRGSGSSSSQVRSQLRVVWQRVCQDECGGRAAAETAFCNAVLRSGGQSRVVLDRCNATAEDRAAWLALALFRSNKQGKALKGVWAVHFDVPAETCIARVAARTDHPTIAHGRGRRAVESFAATLEPPARQEGFERVVTVRSKQEVDELLLLLGAAQPLPAAQVP